MLSTASAFSPMVLTEKPNVRLNSVKADAGSQFAKPLKAKTPRAVLQIPATLIMARKPIAGISG